MTEEFDEAEQFDSPSNTLCVGIVGLGLIGGSLGRAVLKRTDAIVFGKDISPQTQHAAKLVRAITDDLTQDTIPLVDILIFALNPLAIQEQLPQYLPLLKSGCIVTDVGGNKRGVCAAFEQALEQYPHLHFVGAHPMAGKEFSGLKHAVSNLFEGASMLLVPVHTPLNIIATLKQFFMELGFEGCHITSAQEHDKMIAYTSQLCHAISLSYCLHPFSDDCAGFTAGSFRDLTRVARLNPTMWAELFCENRDNLCAVLDEFIETISALKSAVAHSDSAALALMMQSANDIKEKIDRRKNH